MKKLIIIGAGGFGREIHDMVPFSKGYNEAFELKGFINDIEDSLDKFPGYAPIIGRIKDYIPQPDDVFICAIGDIAGRKKCVQLLQERGAEFINLIHQTAWIGRNSTIGKGCIICRNTLITCDCSVGNFSILQDDCLVGHDTRIGDFNQLHARVFVGGRVSIANEVHIGPCAMIHPDKKLGDQSTVGAGSFVIRNIKPGQTVYGNPAKILK